MVRTVRMSLEENPHIDGAHSHQHRPLQNSCYHPSSLRDGGVDSLCPGNSIQRYIATRDKYTSSPRDMHRNVHRDSV